MQKLGMTKNFTDNKTVKIRFPSYYSNIDTYVFTLLQWQLHEILSNLIQKSQK